MQTCSCPVAGLRSRSNGGHSFHIRMPAAARVGNERVFIVIIKPLLLLLLLYYYLFVVFYFLLPEGVNSSRAKSLKEKKNGD